MAKPALGLTAQTGRGAASDFHDFKQRSRNVRDLYGLRAIWRPSKRLKSLTIHAEIRFSDAERIPRFVKVLSK